MRQILNDISRKLVIVVGGYSSGAQLAPTLRGQGYSVIHIQPSEKIYPLLLMAYHPDDYCAQIVCEGDEPAQIAAAVTALRAKLTELGVQAENIPNIHVIAGSEVGVVVADEIAESLQSKTRNVYELRKARREKDAMQAALKAAGVRSIESIKTADFSAITAWMTANKVNFPIVVKPNASGGTDNVTVCNDAEEAQSALAKVLASTDVEGKKNEVALVQEYIGGEEYMVNTVSHGGIHHVTDIVLSTKIRVNGSPAYDLNKLLCPVENAELYAKLTTYIGPALDALGLRYGAAHNEVRIDAKGPVLIETGARTMGAGIDRAAYSRTLGYNHPSAAVDAYINPKKLARYLLPRLRTHTLCLFMLSPEAGTVQQAPDISAFTRLPEFFSAQIASVGCEIKETTSLNNCVGIITLRGPEATIEERYHHFREMEAKIFKKMLSAPASAPVSENPNALYSAPSRKADPASQAVRTMTFQDCR